MSAHFPIVIHHNPDCGTSHNVLELIRAAGYEPTIIDYLEIGWTQPQLQVLLAPAGLTVRDALPITKSPAADLGLLDPSVDDQALLAAMVAQPVLVNRPIAATRRGVRLCRPSRQTLDYEIIVESEELERRLELLHTVIRKFGIISNTLAAAVPLTGSIRRAENPA